MTQNNARSREVSFLDSTLRLKWEVTKDEFDTCTRFGEDIESPTYSVNIGGEESKWGMRMYPMGYEEESKDMVVICLGQFSGKSCRAQYQFRVVTPVGYWPNDFAELLFSKQYRGQFVEFNDNNDWAKKLASTKDFLQQFAEDKISIEATLVIDMKEESYQTHVNAVDDFIGDMRSTASTSDQDHLHDFTIICNGKHFPCHKLFLSLRSKFFKALFVYDKNKTETEIDDSSSEMVEAMLYFITDGLIPKDLINIAMELIPVADKYGPESLTKVCADSLVNNLSPENAVETLILIDRHQHKILPKVLDFIKKVAVKVVNSKDWDKLVERFPALVKDIVIAMAEIQR